MINEILKLYCSAKKVMLFDILKNLPICDYLVSLFIGTIAYIAAIFVFIVQHFIAIIKGNDKMHCFCSKCAIEYLKIKRVIWGIAIGLLLTILNIGLLKISGVYLILYLSTIIFIGCIVIFYIIYIIYKVYNIVSDNKEWEKNIEQTAKDEIEKFCKEQTRVSSKNIQNEKNNRAFNISKKYDLKGKVEFVFGKVNISNNTKYSLYSKDDNVILLKVNFEKLIKLLIDGNLLSMCKVKIKSDIGEGMTKNECYFCIDLIDNDNCELMNSIIKSIKGKIESCFKFKNFEHLKPSVMSFSFLYNNKLLTQDYLMDKDTYPFNYLLEKTILDDKGAALAKNIDNKFTDFFRLLLYHYELFSNSFSVYSFSYICHILIDLFHNNYEYINKYCSNIYTSTIIKTFNRTKDKFDISMSIANLILYIIGKIDSHDESLNFIRNLSYNYDEFLRFDYKGNNNLLNDSKFNVENNFEICACKFQFNSMMCYCFDKLLHDIDNSELMEMKKYYYNNFKEDFFRNFNFFDYLKLIMVDTELMQSFCFVNNYAFNHNDAKYDLFICLVLYFEPLCDYSEEEIRNYYNEIKGLRLQYLYRELKKKDFINEEYKERVMHLIENIMKMQSKSEYKQEYIDKFNRDFRIKFKDRLDFLLPYIYIKILKDNNKVSYNDEINNQCYVPYNKLIFKDVYFDNFWAMAESSSMSYTILYNLDRELLKYFCDNAKELAENINYDDYIVIGVFGAEGKYKYCVKQDDLKIDNEYIKYLYIKKDTLPTIIWPENPKFDLNIMNGVDLSNMKLFERKIDSDVIGNLVLYNAPMIKLEQECVIYKSKYMI